MKTIFTAILSLITGFSFSQAPKQANQIIVESVSYNQVLSTLTDNGYYVDKKFDDLQTVYTVKRQVDEGAIKLFENSAAKFTDVIFYIRVKDSVAYITGKFEIETTKEFGLLPIVNRGMKGSAYRVAWDAMNNIAESLKGKIDYVKN